MAPRAGLQRVVDPDGPERSSALFLAVVILVSPRRGVLLVARPGVGDDASKH